MRYLDVVEIDLALRRGRTVAQWLAPRSEPDQTILRWITLEPRDGGVDLRYCEVFDAADAGTWDFSEFPPVDPDEPEGIVDPQPTLGAALEVAVRVHGAARDRFLDGSVIDSEYEAFRALTH
jgi:hypothetical protein